MNFYEERDTMLEFNINKSLSDLPVFCRLFFDSKKFTLAKLTLKRYLLNFKSFFEFISNKTKIAVKNLEIKDLQNVTVNDVKLFIDSFNNSSIGYRKNILSALNIFFLFYRKLNLISQNIIECIDRPHLPEKPIIYLTPDEIKKLLDAVDNDKRTAAGIHKISKKQLLRDKTILTLFLSTGIRLSELVGLNRGDVDMGNTSITIRRSKNGKFETVYMNKELYEQLSLYFKENLIESDAPLFLSNKGYRLQTNSVEVMLKKYVKLAGINKKITPHKLRATFGTSIYRNTRDIYLTAKLLGHNSVNTTTKYYVELDEHVKRTAINNFHIA